MPKFASRDSVFFNPTVIYNPLHEGLHALTAKLFKARIRVGVTFFGKLLSPYVSVETPLRAREYLFATLAPTLLSVFSLLLAWLFHSNFWALVFVSNTVGMSSDIITAFALFGMPPDAVVCNKRRAPNLRQ
ncbi:DUF3267 domain-containing protein [Thermococcus sp. AM4]|uniref:DUF3267 domain-containing protein n=1 Tax=Thermococcus sp. (strain AM4) TaxID=246969 RepID=UPI0009FC9E97